jgi:short-subunit dehydrogenase
MSVLQGKWAIVTGASSGIGTDFARGLAARGCHLILVARREDRLRALRQELSERHGVQADVIAMSLSEPGAPQVLYDRVRSMGMAVDVLINNAGFGLHGNFTDIPWEREHEMLQLDLVALVHLTKLFVRDMVARDFGFVLQVSSIGAYQPSPTYATYSAAKSFVLNFGEALSYELRHTQVKVSVVSPGVTASEFLQVAGQKPTLYQRMTMMPSRTVAEAGIEAMLKGKPSKVPGLMNALPVWLLRFTPRRMSAAMASAAMQYGAGE